MMILGELKKAIKIAKENKSDRKITLAGRAEWERRYDALRKIEKFVKEGEWADADEREKVVLIWEKGYNAARERYGVSRQALSKAFKRSNDKLEDFVPELTIRLIMQGYISAGLCQLAGAGFMLFPEGVLELLPEPIETNYLEVSSIIADGYGAEFCFLQSLTVHAICKKLERCDKDKLAKLIGALQGTDKVRQLDLAESLMKKRRD